MIDLTPLDVRKKAGDFRRVMRGFDPQEVTTFLELAAERLEELVKENMTLRERSERLQQQVIAHEGRENAVQEALVVAQQLRKDLRVQAEREAEVARMETEARVVRATEEGERRLEETRRHMAELEERRLRFLKGFRALLQRELEAVSVEESRGPEEPPTIEMDLGPRRPSTPRATTRAPEPVPTAEPLPAVAEPSAAAEPEAASEPPARSDEDAAAGALWLSSILREAEGRRGEEGSALG